MTRRPDSAGAAAPARAETLAARTVRGVFRRALTCGIVAGGIVLASIVSTIAQNVTGPALKAGFVYHMPKFIDWPTDSLPTGSAFSACVLGDPLMAEELERVTSGLDYNGHRIAVSRVSAGASVQGCHALYLGQGAAQVATLLADLRDRPILTVSDIEGFTKLGGIAQLYFEGGGLRMFINVDGAQRAKLRVSSRLLRLSKPQ